jgi:signal transduction histidine kinase
VRTAVSHEAQRWRLAPAVLWERQWPAIVILAACAGLEGVQILEGLAEQAERERAAEAERARQELREERVRIARELHDVVAHALAVITVQAGVGRRLMVRRPEEAGSALASIETIGRTAQAELRVVLGLLREEGIGATELSPLPRLADLAELAETVQASRRSPTS